MKLAIKLAAGLTPATALVFGVFAWQLRTAQQRNAEQLITTSAERISDIIRRSTRYQMLRNDREALYETIRDIGREPGIRRIRIFSKTGHIRFSTSDAELNAAVDKSAEACYGCHAQAAPLERLDRKDRARIFSSGGERILGVILPIENQPDCSNAACHVHPASQKVLGVIDAQLSLAAVDRQLAEHNQRMARFTALAVAGICLICIAFLWALIYRPLRNLVKGIRRVASGDLEGTIPVHSRDEVGQVAEEFNHMTGELRQARQEVTEWGRTLEERVERKTRELELAHRSLLHSEKLASVGKLAATVAHEINNPLFGILTNARLSRKQVEQSAWEDGPKNKLASRLSVIERESQRCGEIVKNLLMFSRQSPPRMEPVALSAVLDRAVSLIRHTYQLQNIALEVSVDDSDPLVQGDPGQLQQVLLVLLVNAAEAMPQGGRVAIAVQVRDGDVLLSVRDNGPGIPDELRERIFEPFFSTKEDGQRTGLGLAIASGIVEQHRGEIRVLSQTGQGTEFQIRLPLAATPAPEGALR